MNLLWRQKANTGWSNVALVSPNSKVDTAHPLVIDYREYEAKTYEVILYIRSRSRDVGGNRPNKYVQHTHYVMQWNLM